MRVILGVILAFPGCVVWPSSAEATPLRWTLQNVTFGDCYWFAQGCDPGGTATGSFVFDVATRTFSDWTLVVEGGAAVFPAFAYVPQNSIVNIAYEGTPDEFFNFIGPTSPTYGNRSREFRLAFVVPLTDSGGTVAIDLSNGWVEECYNCEPRRELASGSVTTSVTAHPVPEPASLLLLGAGLVGLRARRRRQQ